MPEAQRAEVDRRLEAHRANPDAAIPGETLRRELLQPGVGYWEDQPKLSDEIRAKLLELAARRGERGFSAVVEEALARYLKEEEGRRARAEHARSVIGAMSEEDARELEESVRTLPERWR